MFIRTTLDPVTLHDVLDPEKAPHLIIGDAENGMDVAFESEETKQIYLNIEREDVTVLEGNDTDDCIAEG